MRRFGLAVAALFVAVGAHASPYGGGEILWDNWGVPHIYGDTLPQQAYGMGWAQAHSHGDLILRLYSQARGDAAAHYGRPLLESDIETLRLGIPSIAQQWTEQASPEYREVLEAFCAGVNDYAAANPGAIAAPASSVLPVRAVDVVAHGLRVIHFTFVAGRDRGQAKAKPWLEENGSNGWAIAPRNAAGGKALLLGNPHLPWGDLYLWFENHFAGPALNFYGASLVGMPLPSLGFNSHLGWTNTVNTHDGVDHFALEVTPSGSYMLDGVETAFEITEHAVSVKNDDGTVTTETIQVKRSQFGPVIAEEPGRALAIKVVGLDRPAIGDQMLAMVRATNMTEFEAAVARQQLPMFNFIYADKGGNILLAFNGLVPRHASGDWTAWQGIVPGNTAQALAPDYLGYAELPRVANPESGWLQNANESPWYMTVPYPLAPAQFAPYVAPPTLPAHRVFRFQRSLRMLMEDTSITFDELAAYSMSARSELADRLMDDLVPLTEKADHPLVADAGKALAAWDREYRAGSRGAVLFYPWWRAYEERCQGAGIDPFAVPWDVNAAPLATPDGIADPRGALSALEQVAGNMATGGVGLDVPWGDVMRMRMGGVDEPSSGGPSYDTFRVLQHERQKDGSFQAVHGNSFIFLTEFTEPPHARVLTVYGNATQPAAGHSGDQLPLFARDEYREALLTREAIEANTTTKVALAKTEAAAVPVEAAPVEPVPTPEPAPAPEPMPEAVPAPEVAPMPAPEALPEVELVPEPVPAPEPAPAPEAVPVPAP
jgi:acyl-homoserine-lactone acylase